MVQPNLISQKMREHYEQVWREGNAWSFETSPFEQERFDHQREFISGYRYERVLEIGCGSGCFTCRLAGLAARVVALDIAPAAVDRARTQVEAAGIRNVEFRVADAM